MRPKTIGRSLGIGLRVASRVAGQRLAAQGQAGGHFPPTQRVGTNQTAIHGRSVGRGVARGIGAFLRPFGHVGRVVWLEVAGVFFLLPVLIFARGMWRIRASWEHGPDHIAFLVSGAVVLLFLYLSVTSFWRAWRK